MSHQKVTNKNKTHALIIAAAASSHGKTTVSSGLACLLSKQGQRVKVFKCGPDFLDPQIHKVASGNVCENIDFRLAGEDEFKIRLKRAVENFDVILFEGVMGLDDGKPSASELAKILDVPMLLVIDARAMSGCFGALAWGLKYYKGAVNNSSLSAHVNINYVFANRVGSDYHGKLCNESLPEDIKMVGFLKRDDEVALPERHLGLLPASEIDGLVQKIDNVANELLATNWLELIPKTDFASYLENTPEISIPKLLNNKTIAIARDSSFCFIYPSNLECLENMGAKIMFFSPLTDSELPACDALWLPGGYPELHADKLAQNKKILQSIKNHVNEGKAVLAECGGMMLCFENLIDIQGKVHKMAGVLAGQVQMQKKLAGLGMLSVSLPEGDLRGHTFHYSLTQSTINPLAQAVKDNGRGGESVYRHNRLTAGYMHFYFPSNPSAVAKLFE